MRSIKKITSISAALEALDQPELAARSRQWSRKVDAQARKNPWLFIAVAALLAVFLGFLAGRKSKD